MSTAQATRVQEPATRSETLSHLAMVIGFGGVGVSAFALLAAGPRLLGPDGYSSLALTWTVVTIGIAAPGEQTITRGIASGAGTGVISAVGRRLALLPIIVVGLLPVSVMVLEQELLDAALWTTTLAVAAIGWVVVARIRGILAGGHRFGAYATTLVTESAVRILLVVGAAVWTSYAPVLLAAAMGVPLLASAAAGWWVLRGAASPPSAVIGDDSRKEQLAITTVALMGQLCLSTAPLWLHFQSADLAIAGQFVTATAYMRIPLLLAGGMYGPTLADAARQYALGNRRGVEQRTLIALAAAVGGSTAAAVLLYLAARPALYVLYGSDVGLSDGVLILLGAGTIGFVAASVLTQVLYGCQRAPSAAVAWIAPAVLTTLLLSIAGGDVARVAASVAAGQVLAVVLLLALLPRALPGRYP
jgi:O-antigen/teichoic acid export membrane protein